MAKKEVIKDKVKIISLGALIASCESSLGLVKRYEVSLTKIYTENKVLAYFDVKGDKLFVCEV